ncbi:MAG: 2-C-methyl-D-erythritol 4-phosphate cytidylyltransferase [Longimicrobiales bacterium]
MTPLKVGVVVPAAGSGRRMGGVRKPFLELRGLPTLVHALRPFLARTDVVAVAVALAADDAAEPPSWLTDLDSRITVVAGGSSRTRSVALALAALPDDVDLVAIHDAARPLVTGELIEACVRAAAEGQGAVAGCPAVDTVKEVDADGRVVGTPDRARLWYAHTPQVFPAALARAAYARADDAGATDDAALVERAGGTVRMVDGGTGNLKVTRPEDVAVAEALLSLREAGSRA